MNYSILNFLTLLGAVGLFLYGMKVMSEGLQKVAGDRMRNILSVMTKNRFAGVLTGILITALIQSSSASTVMVVSFVNAGLMSLAQSMAVIMGANIGTILTGYKHLSGGDESLASHLRLWVVGEKAVENCITDLVSHLVGVALRY